MKTGIELIHEERQRQIKKEGWTPQHDDTHKAGELAIAGACYAFSGSDKITAATFFWPWRKKNGGVYDEPDGFKPTPCSPVRDLVKAGALIAAEIDRLQRAAARPEGGKP